MKKALDAPAEHYDRRDMLELYEALGKAMGDGKKNSAGAGRGVAPKSARLSV